MLELYANQEFGWRHRTGTKDNGTAIFNPARPAAPLTVKGRIDYKRRLIRNEKGEQVVSEARVLTMSAVDVGDIVVIGGREWPVLKAGPEFGLLGEELHREVFL